MSAPASPLFDSIPTAISAFAKGEFIIVLDSPGRENEGDLIILASAMTPGKAAFIIHHSSGYLCAPMPAKRADALGLDLMVPANASTDPNRTAYTITVDAYSGVTTGISAEDRSHTCKLLADPTSTPAEFRRPGHIVPLRAHPGGVRARQGHTEAAVEFARLAGAEADAQVGVIGEIVEWGQDVRNTAVNGAGPAHGQYIAERTGVGMMRRDGCLEFGKRYGIPVVTIEDLVAYLEETEPSTAEYKKILA